MINAEVFKTGNENNVNLIKRFTKRVQGAGILPKVRATRYKLRNQSKLSVKKLALKKLGRRKEVEQLIKMGKMPEKKTKRF